jgi:transposase
MPLKKDCFICEVRARSTHSKKSPRGLTLHPKDQQLAIQAPRECQQTESFKDQYAIRSSIEGTIVQATDKSGILRSDIVG